MIRPTVSVVITCFNLGQYVDDAVDSVLAQTRRDFEIIIVNDGSTDPATNDLLDDYRRPQTRVVRTENRGLAAARNLGITLSRGAYLCALDADDRLAPTYFEKAGQMLDDDHSLTFVSSWLETFGEETWVWKQSRCDLPTLLAECTVSTAALVRAAAVRAVGGYDERMPHAGYEDWDLWLSLVERGFRGAIVPEVLFFYRRRAGSMSSICCHGKPHLDLMEYLVEKHKESYERHLHEVLRRRDHDIAELLTSNDALERRLETWLVPELHRRRAELEELRRKLDDAERQEGLRLERAHLADEVVRLERERTDEHRRRLALDAAVAAASQEVRALRTSWSWRATAPARTVYDWLLKIVARNR